MRFSNAVGEARKKFRHQHQPIDTWSVMKRNHAAFNRFCEYLLSGEKPGSVLAISKEIGISRQALYAWLKNPLRYVLAKAWTLEKECSVCGERKQIIYFMKSRKCDYVDSTCRVCLKGLYPTQNTKKPVNYHRDNARRYRGKFPYKVMMGNDRSAYGETEGCLRRLMVCRPYIPKNECLEYLRFIKIGDKEVINYLYLKFYIIYKETNLCHTRSSYQNLN